LSLYILDNRELYPALNFTYELKIAALLREGFQMYRGQIINGVDSLLVGIFGCPYLKQQTRAYASYSKEIISKFSDVTFLLEDLHPYSYLWFSLNRHYSSYKFITCYNEVVENPRFKNTVWVPHHVDTSIFKPLNIEKDIDILVYGSLDPNVYPERDSFLREHPNSYVVPHPGYDRLTHSINKEELARLINRAHYALVSPSKYGYLTAKYFEVAACNTIPIGYNCRDGEILNYELNKSNYQLALNFSLEQYPERIKAAMRL